MHFKEINPKSNNYNLFSYQLVYEVEDKKMKHARLENILEKCVFVDLNVMNVYKLTQNTRSWLHKMLRISLQV